MSVAFEKYRQAVETLVSSNDSIRTRLVPALETLLGLTFADVPEDLRKSFVDICNGISSTTDPTGNGPVRAYVNGHTEREASDLAVRILGTYTELCRRAP